MKCLSRLLRGLRSVNNLYLSGAGITDAGVMNLKGLRHLSVVGLTGTQVTRPGAKRLIDEAPNLYADDLDSQRITR